MKRTTTTTIKAADAVGDEVPNVDNPIVSGTRGSLQHTTSALVVLMAPIMAITRTTGLASCHLQGYRRGTIILEAEWWVHFRPFDECILIASSVAPSGWDSAIDD